MQKIVNPSQRLVCCADILGFSPKFKRMHSIQKYDEYFQIINVLKSSCHNIGDYRVDPPEYSWQRVNFYWFSDTFILYSREFQFDSCEHDICPEALSDMLRDFFISIKSLFLRFLYHGFPLRGGIDYGEYIADPEQNIFLGEAGIRAYKTSEKHAWAGISVLPNLSDRISRESKVNELLVAYQIPLKDKASQELKVLDWPSDNTIKTKENPEGYIRAQFMKHCITLDNNAEVYCSNTISFLKDRLR